MNLRQDLPGGALRPLWALTESELVAILQRVVREELADAKGAFPDGLMSLQQTAQFCGVSVRQLHRLREAGLPTLWLIDSPRFERASIIEWLRANGRKQP